MWQVCLRKILSEIEMLAYDVLRRESAPDSEGCSGAQLGGHLLIPASQTFITCTPYTTLQTRRPGMTTGTAQNVNKSCVQGTMDTSPCGHFGPQHSVLTTYNRELSEAGTWALWLTLTALGSKIQVIEFLGGQYKIRLVTSGNE